MEEAEEPERQSEGKSERESEDVDMAEVRGDNGGEIQSLSRVEREALREEVQF